MKQHFPWMFLLPLIILVGPSMGLFGNDGKCDSDGIVGTFGLVKGTPNIVESLTITPVNFTKSLQVKINKAGDSETDKGIQIYVVIDEDSECNVFKEGELSIVFTISDDGLATGQKCEFTYKWDFKHKNHTLNMQEIALSFGDPYQASFEVRKKDGKYAMIISDSSKGEIYTEDKNVAKCFKDEGANTLFFLTVSKPAEWNGKECGVQLEMKGNYEYKTLTMDTKPCEKIDYDGCTDEGKDCPTPTTTDDGSKTDDDSNSGLTWWEITLIVVGAVLLLLLVVGAIVYFVVIRPKKEAAAANEDIEAESAVPEDPPVPEDALETPEEQQNNKSEDESQDA